MREQHENKKKKPSESRDSLWLQAFRGGQQDGEQLNQVLHCPKYTYPQKRPNIWEFKIARVKAIRPPCRESRRLPMASTAKKKKKIHQCSIYYTCNILHSLFSMEGFSTPKWGTRWREGSLKCKLHSLLQKAHYADSKKTFSKMPVGKFELPTAPQGQSNLLSSHLCGFQSNSNFSVH